MTTLEAILLVESAGNAAVLFKGHDFKELAKLLHPDTAESKLKARAGSAFRRLSAFRDSLNHKPAAPSATVIGKYVITEPLAAGDIADVHRCHKIDAPDLPLVIKIARSPKDNDLMAVEARTMKELTAEKSEFLKYLPVLESSFEASGRRANVFFYSHGISLADLRGFFPRGLDFRHIVWMGNRALSALGIIHRTGIVHGAVLPEHLLFKVEDHGLTLVDHCYSVKMGEKVKALSKPNASLYAPEIPRKLPAWGATDLFMLFASLRAAAENVPRRFTSIFDYCMAGSPKSRPQDAWELQDRWSALAKEEYGPPQFVKLVLPTN